MKDTWIKPTGRMETREGGGFGWGQGEGWGENAGKEILKEFFVR